jgi:threonine aldolase
VRLHNADLRGFASDNYAGAHPEVLAAIAEANGGHQISYGEDVYTERLTEVMHAHFGEQAEVFPVFNGTGANVVALSSVLPRWGAVVATSTARSRSSSRSPSRPSSAPCTRSTRSVPSQTTRTSAA